MWLWTVTALSVIKRKVRINLVIKAVELMNREQGSWLDGEKTALWRFG